MGDYLGESRTCSSHISTPGTCFLDALRHQRDGNHEEIARRFSRRNARTVPAANTARIQECHIAIRHIWCELVEFDQLQWVSSPG